MEKLFFIFIIIFEIKTDIIDNPNLLGNGTYPFLLSSPYNETNFLITSEKIFRLNKENGSIETIYCNDIFNYSQNSILIKDKSKNNFIYDKELDKYYKIEYKSDGFGMIPIDLNLTNDPNSIIFGSIVQDDYFIIYGLIEKKIFFSSHSQTIWYSEDINDINNELSCKHIVGKNFICAMIINQYVKLYIFKYDSKKESGCLKKINSQTLESTLDPNSFLKFVLYDTSQSYIKFFCGKHDGGNGEMYCIFFECTIRKNQEYIFHKPQSFSFDFPYFSHNSCDFTEFDSEYLFCCGYETYIKCFKLDKIKFNVTREFEVAKPKGIVSYLTIQNNIDYLIFYFMNSNNEGSSIYESYIYKPICDNKNFT